MKYYLDKTVKDSFDEAVRKVKKALQDEGFGVLSEIDIHEKLKEKLDVDFRQYKILGACNPPYAHKALLLEDKIGTMLPCNVIVQETKAGATEVAAVNPVASMISITNPDLAVIADDIKKKLQKVIDSLA